MVLLSSLFPLVIFRGSWSRLRWSTWRLVVIIVILIPCMGRLAILLSLTGTRSGCWCQEIGLVAFMFFFELLFSYVSSPFPSMFPLTNLFSIILFLICSLPKTLKTKEKQDFDSTNTGNSLKVILRLKNLERFLNRPVAPLVDLYQSLHSNSASTTSISPSI